MKIVTYNVNGLRSRVAQHGSLLKLLNSLDADIICFQETKLSRQDLSADLTMAEGYEAFVSCTRTCGKGRTSYSGVATFCRVTSAFSSNEVALPLAAEEGFTGLLGSFQRKEIMSSGLHETTFLVEGLEDMTNKDLLKVDSEGRCVITDHGHFVLFNLYGPRAVADDEERLHFKLLFFKILQKRWESLLNQGKRIFVAGDLNIAPAAIDKCDAEPDFEKNMFREWLRSLLREQGGPFFDVFRSKHPERKEAYTCFPQNVGAEEYNYGSRIDHIFIAGPCFHQTHDLEGHNLLDCHVEECDILSQFIRGKADNAPKWDGGRSVKIEGSDHIPVYVILNNVPDLPLHSTPSLSVRYIPEVRGWQQTIVSLFARRQVASRAKCHELSNNNAMTESSVDSAASSHNLATSQLDILSCKSNNLDHDEVHNLGLTNEQLVNCTENTTIRFRSPKTKLLSKCHNAVNRKGRHSTCSQLTLRSFFQQPKALMSADMDTEKADTSNYQLKVRKETGNSSHVPDDSEIHLENVKEGSSERNESGISVSDSGNLSASICSSSQRDTGDTAVLEWQRIHQKMKMTLPICKVHGEPCVARLVKKEGPNIGREFYTCARAKGPASNPEANCGHFEWSSLKFKKKKSIFLSCWYFPLLGFEPVPNPRMVAL